MGIISDHEDTLMLNKFPTISESASPNKKKDKPNKGDFDWNFEMITETDIDERENEDII